MGSLLRIRKKIHTFGASFVGWLEFEPNTSFPERWREAEVDGLESLAPFSPSSWCCLSMGEETGATDSVEGFPSNRLAEPVNGLNLATF